MLKKRWMTDSFLPFFFQKIFLAIFKVEKLNNQFVSISVDPASRPNFKNTFCNLNFKLAMIFVSLSVQTNVVRQKLFLWIKTS